jgi:CDGSH-type Zn-finger protein
VIRIKVSENGPLRIDAEDAANVVIVDAAGNEIPSLKPEKKSIALCRCGASATKPYCDGTHKTIWQVVQRTE